jgi:hypothetical protein
MFVAPLDKEFVINVFIFFFPKTFNEGDWNQLYGENIGSILPTCQNLLIYRKLDGHQCQKVSTEKSAYSMMNGSPKRKHVTRCATGAVLILIYHL